MFDVVFKMIAYVINGQKTPAEVNQLIHVIQAQLDLGILEDTIRNDGDNDLEGFEDGPASTSSPNSNLPM